MPKENADGNLVWNPSVGIYHDPAKNKRESYGGIIGALQDQITSNGGTTKAYPENFAGIISAIKDLDLTAETPPVDIGPKPPGGDVIIDINGNPIWIITEKPGEGTLWFDTRQGRMFVWIDDDWYQTNGGDGIPIVTPDDTAPAIQYAVPGQMWYDKLNNNLFIFSGDYMADDGSINTDGDGQMLWKLVADLDQDFLQTTATLPLSVIGPRIQEARTIDELEYIPTDDAALFEVQRDYNQFVFAYLENLDHGLQDIQPVYVGDTPPPQSEVKPGQLWYDTESLEMSIAYEDDDRIQWVPVSAAYNYDDDLTEVRSLVATESRVREEVVHTIFERLENIDVSDAAEITALQASLDDLQAQITDIPTYNLGVYLKEVTFNDSISLFDSRLDAVEAITNVIDEYAKTTYVDTQINQVEVLLAGKASTTDLATVQAAIPDVSYFTTSDDVADAIANITTEYLPRTGGKLTGSFVVEKEDYSLPGFDFSQAAGFGKEAFKFSTIGSGSSTSTFGTTDSFWEYAWNFEADEDFCWIYNDTNKVFSITKDGPACSTLVLGDFGDNTTNGRLIHNKIDVKERLNTYQAAFEDIRQGVSNATDFDSLKANILSALASV